MINKQEKAKEVLVKIKDAVSEEAMILRTSPM